MKAPIVSPALRTAIADPAGECDVMQWQDADMTTKVRSKYPGHHLWSGQLWDRVAESAVRRDDEAVASLARKLGVELSKRGDL